MTDSNEEFQLPNLYSRRLRALAAEAEDVFLYNETPPKIRVQTVQILEDAIGPYYTSSGDEAPGHKAYDYLVRTMRREAGVNELSRTSYGEDPSHEFYKWLAGAPVGDFIDAVELALRVIDTYVRGEANFRHHASVRPDKAIAEFNARCREARFGYCYSGGTIIRVDSQFLHQQAVLPVLSLLSRARFKAADQEFREAHEAFRGGNYKDCLVGCGRAFESVLKIIGTDRGWNISPNDPASKLISAATTHGFLAAHSQASLNHLRGLLESSVPTVRNKMGGHGAGQEPVEVAEELATFQLHQTAAVILFLVEHDERLPKG